MSEYQNQRRSRNSGWTRRYGSIENHFDPYDPFSQYQRPSLLTRTASTSFRGSYYGDPLREHAAVLAYGLRKDFFSNLEDPQRRADRTFLQRQFQAIRTHERKHRPNHTHRGVTWGLRLIQKEPYDLIEEEVRWLRQAKKAKRRHKFYNEVFLAFPTIEKYREVARRQLDGDSKAQYILKYRNQISRIVTGKPVGLRKRSPQLIAASTREKSVRKWTKPKNLKAIDPQMKQIQIQVLDTVSTSASQDEQFKDRTDAKVFLLTAKGLESYIDPKKPPIVVMSGQNYSAKDQLTMAINLAKLTGHPVMYVSNVTEGKKDYYVSGRVKIGHVNGPVLALMKIFAGMYGPIDSAIGHSQGGIYISEALRRLSPRTIKGLNVMTFGGGAWEYPSGIQADHFVDGLDPVAFLVGQRWSHLWDWGNLNRVHVFPRSQQKMSEFKLKALSIAHSAHSYFGYEEEGWNYDQNLLSNVPIISADRSILGES